MLLSLALLERYMLHCHLQMHAHMEINPTVPVKFIKQLSSPFPVWINCCTLGGTQKNRKGGLKVLKLWKFVSVNNQSDIS